MVMLASRVAVALVAVIVIGLITKLIYAWIDRSSWKKHKVKLERDHARRETRLMDDCIQRVLARAEWSTEEADSVTETENGEATDDSSFIDDESSAAIKDNNLESIGYIHVSPVPMQETSVTRDGTPTLESEHNQQTSLTQSRTPEIDGQSSAENTAEEEAAEEEAAEEEEEDDDIALQDLLATSSDADSSSESE